MNKTKNWSYNKLIAFFLIVVALMSILVVSASGWQAEGLPSENQGTEAEKNSGTDQDEEKLPTVTTPPEPEKESQKFYHPITGLEVSEEESLDTQVAYVIDGNSPLCGIANCNLLIEIPIEDGKTRYIMIADKNSTFKKIGSITYYRNSMANLAVVFGASVVSLGNDDIVEYKSLTANVNFIDLYKNKGTYYTEYTYFTYTSPALVGGMIQADPNQKTHLPYTFANENSECKGIIIAEKIEIPYSTETTVIYSNEKKEYTLCKMGSDKIDVSTSESASFDNILILFSDSVTYENSNSTQMIMSTIGQGEGYYAFEGVAQKIRWTLEEDGEMTFYNESGEKLEIQRGTTYISYVKSSKSSDVKFS